jgi:hypothetical protein
MEPPSLQLFVCYFSLSLCPSLVQLFLPSSTTNLPLIPRHHTSSEHTTAPLNPVTLASFASAPPSDPAWSPPHGVGSRGGVEASSSY